MDKKTKSYVEEQFRRGVLKTNMGRIEGIMNRAYVSGGKVLTGADGAAYNKMQMDKQNYYKRNR